jgi:hypothetical protein
MLDHSLEKFDVGRPTGRDDGLVRGGDALSADKLRGPSSVSAASRVRDGVSARLLKIKSLSLKSLTTAANWSRSVTACQTMTLTTCHINHGLVNPNLLSLRLSGRDDDARELGRIEGVLRRKTN